MIKLSRLKLGSLITVGLISVFTILLLNPSSSALDIPPTPKSSYVVDNAEILSADEENKLNQQIEAIKQSSSNEIGVLTVKNGDGVDPAQYATQVGREWGIGTKENKNGVLIFVSLENPRRIQIAVSTGLEGALTDAISGSISRNEIAPKFKESKYFEGLQNGISAIDQATKGEYLPKDDNKSSSASSSYELIFFLIFVIFSVIQVVFSLLASSKSWWLGGIFGAFGSAFIGLITFSILNALLLCVIFVPLGLLLDYKLSKNYQKHANKRKKDKTHVFPWYFGGGGGFGSGSGGGFSGGGFSGGGSFGGGGGGSSW